MQWLQWGVAVAVSLAAAVWDIRTRRIPNVLTGPALVGGLVWSGIVAGPAGLADAAVGCVAMMFVFVLLFLLAGGGAGDAKLMGALGTWLGTVNGLFALGGVLLAGALLGIAYAAMTKRLTRVLRNVRWILLGWLFILVGRGRLIRPADVQAAQSDIGAKMPYGVAVFVGVCAAAVGVWLWRASGQSGFGWVS